MHFDGFKYESTRDDRVLGHISLYTNIEDSNIVAYARQYTFETIDEYHKAI